MIQLKWILWYEQYYHIILYCYKQGNNIFAILELPVDLRSTDITWDVFTHSVFEKLTYLL